MDALVRARFTRSRGITTTDSFVLRHRPPAPKKAKRKVGTHTNTHLTAVLVVVQKLCLASTMVSRMSFPGVGRSLFLFLVLLSIATNKSVPVSVSATASTASDAAASSTCTSKFVRVGHNNDEPTLRVILIRHGESQNNVKHEVSKENYLEHRQADPALTENGKLQAQRAADYITSGANAMLSNIDELYVSPFLRTMMTAAPIAKALGMPAKVWTDIYEVGGVHEEGVGVGGLTRSQIQERFPTYEIPEDGSVTEDGWYDKSRNKETRQMGKDRIVGVFQTLLEWAKKCKEEGKDKTIALVVHGDFIDFTLQAAYGVNGLDHVFPCYNTCMSVLDLTTTRKPMVLFHNSVLHLENSLVKFDKLNKC